MVPDRDSIEERWAQKIANESEKLKKQWFAKKFRDFVSKNKKKFKPDAQIKVSVPVNNVKNQSTRRKRKTVDPPPKPKKM